MHAASVPPRASPSFGDLRPWPLEKFLKAQGRDHGQASAVVVTTGAMNPPHRGHVQLLRQAAARLAREGYEVVGLWLSPSHDGYVQPKAMSLKTVGLSAAFRLELARRAVATDELVEVGAWEAQQPGRWPDFPEVARALKDEMSRLHTAGEIQGCPTVFYACGTDHAAKCGLYNGLPNGIGVVVVPRDGEAVGPENTQRLVFVAEAPTDPSLASLSSTGIRKAIAAKDYARVERSMSKEAAEAILKPAAEEYRRFACDFEQLGVRAPGRQVYISLSSIFRMWDRDGPTLLRKISGDALFFFGSKRSWVFPEGQAEVGESMRENPKYTSPSYQQIRDLILEKESADQVFFLKPPGFKYNGDLFHGDPNAFGRASDWLARHTDPSTGACFRPLLLDPVWWRTGFKPSEGKYTTRVEAIIKNFECGAHDYDPVMELLYQSNPNLDIVL